MVTQPTSPSEFQVITTTVEALAGAAVAFFAAAQWRRDSKHDKQLRKGAESRASTVAFLLRRQLRAWLGADRGKADSLAKWIEESRENRTLGKQIDIAEQRAFELATLAEGKLAVAAGAK